MNTVLRQERIARQWTLKHVAACTGITKSAAHDIETGRRRPSYEVLVRLENLFGMTHRELFAPAPEETKET